MKYIHTLLHLRWRQHRKRAPIALWKLKLDKGDIPTYNLTRGYDSAARCLHRVNPCSSSTYPKSHTAIHYPYFGKRDTLCLSSFQVTWRTLFSVLQVTWQMLWACPATAWTCPVISVLWSLRTRPCSCSGTRVGAESPATRKKWTI